ncbi:MAG: hypothetical protein M3Q10_18440 [Chloroflexota bacterium]|nr:hypothetical protein [Chloroflexota bacterium]
MHPYGTDSNERFYVLAFLVPLSFWLSGLATEQIERARLSWPAEADFLADPTSAAFVYGALYALFNAYLWRLGVLRWIGLVSTPDLNGTWRGVLRSSHDDFATEKALDLTIEQSWTRMVVRIRTAQSASHSRTASLLLNAGPGKTLSYTYLNQPNTAEGEAMAIHQGTAVLVLHGGARPHRLEGEYYNSRGRRTFGQISVARFPSRERSSSSGEVC